MTLDNGIEFDREEDGRWIAEAIDLPGVMAYGATQQDARNMVEALIRDVIAEHETLG
jgi:predicted RNase H-like HicB family nuclease